MMLFDVKFRTFKHLSADPVAIKFPFEDQETALISARKQVTFAIICENYESNYLYGVHYSCKPPL